MKMNSLGSQMRACPKEDIIMNFASRNHPLRGPKRMLVLKFNRKVNINT